MKKFAQSRLVPLLAVLALVSAVACGTQATPTPTPTPTPTAVQGGGEPTATPAPGGGDWQAELQRITDAARQEGEINVISGFTTQLQIPAFEAAFPDIRLNYLQLRAPDLAQRLPTEQSAGRFDWDVVFIGGSGGVDTSIPRTLFEPIRDKIIDPSLHDDATWVGDFDDLWVDVDDRQYKLQHRSNLAPGTTFWVNRQVAPNFNGPDDFFAPEMQGKICAFDPRLEGATDAGMAQLIAMFGQDWVRRLMAETGMVISNNATQLTQDLVAGTYAACIGTAIEQFHREGIGLHVEQVHISNPAGLHPDYAWIENACCGAGKERDVFDGWMASGAAYTNIQIGRNPPNPNAAQLLLNWVLSREGAMAFMDPTDTACSMRADLHNSYCVEELNRQIPNQFLPLQEGGSYPHISKSDTVQVRYEARDLARQVFPN